MRLVVQNVIKGAEEAPSLCVNGQMLIQRLSSDLQLQVTNPSILAQLVLIFKVWPGSKLTQVLLPVII